jgi:hypothetical protein
LLGVGVTSVSTGVVFVPPKVAFQLVTNALAMPFWTYTCVVSYWGPTAIDALGLVAAA